MRRCRTLCLLLLASRVVPAQQSPSEPASVTFQAQTRLVLLSFHVARNKDYVGDLKRESFVLLEDGKPRDFTIFDSPATQGRMPVELVLLFDANPKINYFWDPQAVFRFVTGWDESMSRAILEKDTADIRISVYHCAGQKLHRLSSATTDPLQLTTALRGILSPLDESAAIPLSLPRQREHVAPGPFTNDYVTSPFVSAEARGWPMEAAIATLNEVAVAQEKVARVMVMFSEGIGATTTIPEDLGNQALDLGIPIYPIATNYQNHIDESWPRNLFRMRQFEALGKITGGRAVEYKEIDAATLGKILESVKSHGLSQYVVGFAPSSSSAAKGHRLEIRLASKSLGTLEGGKRRAVY